MINVNLLWEVGSFEAEIKKGKLHPSSALHFSTSVYRIINSLILANNSYGSQVVLSTTGMSTSASSGFMYHVSLFIINLKLYPNSSKW